jgi:AcrR family transcriptional regulator
MTTKDTIISETRKLFSRKGFMSTTIQDIMDSTGISKGGLYNHFKSKEDIFMAVLEQSRMIWREKNLEGLDQIKSPIERIVRFLENYRDNYIIDTENFPGGCIFVNLSVELDDQLPHMAKEVEKGFIGLKNMIGRFLEEAKQSGELKEGIYIKDATEIVVSAAIGAAVIYAQEKSASTLNRSMNALIGYTKSLVR